MKKTLPLLFFVFAGIFSAAFAGFIIRDYIVLYPWGSAPFYLYVLERAAELLLPAAACLIAGIILRKKNSVK